MRDAKWQYQQRPSKSYTIHCFGFPDLFCQYGCFRSDHNNAVSFDVLGLLWHYLVVSFLYLALHCLANNHVSPITSHGHWVQMTISLKGCFSKQSYWSCTVQFICTLFLHSPAWSPVMVFYITLVYLYYDFYRPFYLHYKVCHSMTDFTICSNRSWNFNYSHMTL